MHEIGLKMLFLCSMLSILVIVKLLFHLFETNRENAKESRNNVPDNYG